MRLACQYSCSDRVSFKIRLDHAKEVHTPCSQAVELVRPLRGRNHFAAVSQVSNPQLRFKAPVQAQQRQAVAMPSSAVSPIGTPQLHLTLTKLSS